jgi:hypothetical protein
MSITQLEFDTLNNAFAVAKTDITDLQPRLDELREIYDSAGGVKETLTQDDLNGVAALSGLTKGQADDGFYALTAVLLPALETSYTALAQMAARSRGFAPPLMIAPPTPPVP